MDANVEGERHWRATAHALLAVYGESGDVKALGQEAEKALR